MAIKVFHRDGPALQVPTISQDARFIVWPGVGARTASMNYVVLEPGEGNTAHSHPVSEDVIFILEGKGSVHDLTNQRLVDFGSTDAIFIPPGLVHATIANKGQRVISVGGPTPPDMAMLRAAGIEL